MGYSLSLIAIQSSDPDLALSCLGVVRTGKSCEYAREPMSGYMLAENWYLIVIQDCHSHFLKPKVLGTLSQNYPVLACSVEEHVMFSSAAYWRNGNMIWKAEHIGENGPIHLKTSGVLLSGFEKIVTAQMEQQQIDGGDKADVDHYFDIPLLAAKYAIGFKHDEEIAGIDYDHFECLSEVRPSIGRNPWWHFWK